MAYTQLTQEELYTTMTMLLAAAVFATTAAAMELDGRFWACVYRCYSMLLLLLFVAANLISFSIVDDGTRLWMLFFYHSFRSASFIDCDGCRLDGRSVGCLDFVCASISNLVPGFWFANPLLPICSNVFHSHFRHHKFPFSIPKPIQMLPIVAFVVPFAWIHFYEWFGMSHSHHHWLASQCATIATAFFHFFHNALMFFHHKHCSRTPHSFCSILCRWMRTPSAHNNNSNRSGRKRTRETRAIVHYILCWINVVHCSAEQKKSGKKKYPRL